MYKTYELTLFDLDDNDNYKWTVPKQRGRDVAQALINTRVLSEDEIRRLLVICGMNRRRRDYTDVGHPPEWLDLKGWVPNPDKDDRLRNLRIFIKKSTAASPSTMYVNGRWSSGGTGSS